jgi:hypothetical protein
VGGENSNLSYPERSNFNYLNVQLMGFTPNIPTAEFAIDSNRCYTEQLITDKVTENVDIESLKHLLQFDTFIFYCSICRSYLLLHKTGTFSKWAAGADRIFRKER